MNNNLLRINFLNAWLWNVYLIWKCVLTYIRKKPAQRKKNQINTLTGWRRRKTHLKCLNIFVDSFTDYTVAQARDKPRHILYISATPCAYLWCPSAKQPAMTCYWLTNTLPTFLGQLDNAEDRENWLTDCQIVIHLWLLYYYHLYNFELYVRTWLFFLDFCLQFYILKQFKCFKI